jgi:hypothetical protein
LRFITTLLSPIDFTRDVGGQATEKLTAKRAK